MNQKKLAFIEPSIVPILPSICCYCGAPAEELLDIDARRSSEWFGYKWTASINYGNRFRVPYCTEHYPIAVMMRKKLARLANAQSSASFILLVLSIAAGVVFVFRQSGNLLFALTVGVFLGVLLGGALLFAFEPLSKHLAGVVFPLFLEPLVRADLVEHMKAQHEIYPFRILWLTYSLGFSIKYEITHTMEYGFREWNAHQSVCATNAEFASLIGGIQCVRVGKRDVCGKCGITQKERLRQWNAPASPGVIKIGSERGAFMYCKHCQMGICGACSIDLGMTAGCPMCRTELVYMDGGRQ